MIEPGFIHLRVHSAYSLSEGAIRVNDLISICRTQDMPAVAVTDSGNLFGALEFSMAAMKAGIQPIVGCALAVAWPAPESAANGAEPSRANLDRMVLLASNQRGYENLLKLVSRSYMESESVEAPHVTCDVLEAHAEGLIAFTGGPDGPIGRLLLDGQEALAETRLKQLHTLFGDRLYVEIMRHNVDAERRIEPKLIEFAYNHDIPLVATNDVFFADEAMYEAHDALLCIAEGRYVAEDERRRVTPEHRFKTAAEMRSLFSDLPEAVANTVVIAQRCSYMPEPIDPILPPFASEGGRAEPEELRAQVEAGLTQRLETHVFTEDMEEAAREKAAKPYRDRLDFELSVIGRMGYDGYFLIVADFIQWAKGKGIPVGPGRGSGAGSVVAWALAITDLDPLRFNLLFERFLNPDRVSMPDFDIDFCQERRDEVIQYVQQKYGRDKVAQIITFGTLQARAALRDVGRVLEMPYNQVDRICKLVPNNPANPTPLAQAIKEEARLLEMRDSEPAVARLMDTALKLEGLYRHASTHAAGVVIGDRPLEELVPLYRDPRSEMPVTQFSMKYVEQAGLVKFDFLGLKTLTVLSKTCEFLARRGIEVDLATLPLDDQATFALMSRADTIGVFQFESSGMRSLLRDAGVGSLEDMIALVALYRPGPMENIPKYVACKYGREKPDMLHDTIDPVVEDTYGVIIYQEQVMQIAQVFAGYSLGQADLLRRAMGKKIKSEMDAQRSTFVEGAVAKGVDRNKAKLVFELVAKFAEYGFNKSHSACYALVAYQTAYLKAHYPVEFMAALMTLDLGNTDKLNIFRQEVDRLGIPLLPPDVNRSEASFSVEATDDGTLGVRYALGAIKNVGHKAMEGVVAEREANGRFETIFDFANRLDASQVNKRQVENLASSGAFDALLESRAQARASAEAIVRAASDASQRADDLFAAVDGGEAPRFRLADVPAWATAELLEREYDAIGFYLSAHPLDEYAESLARMGVTPSAELAGKLRGDGNAVSVKLAGNVLSKKERTSQKGNRFAFVSLSDTSGVYEITIFAEVLNSARELLEAGVPVLIHGNARLDGEQPRILADRIEALDTTIARNAPGLRVYVDDAHSLATLASVMERTGKGKGRVRLVLDIEDQEVEIEIGEYAVSPAVRSAIKAIQGVVDVMEA